MYQQKPIITLLMIFLSSLLICNGSYIVEPLHQANFERYYHVHDGRLIKTKHQHFGHITRTNRDAVFSSKSQGIVSVDDFGARADGRDDREVKNNNNIYGNKDWKIYYVNSLTTIFSDFLTFSFHLIYPLRHLRRHGMKHVLKGLSLWYQKIGYTVSSQ